MDLQLKLSTSKATSTTVQDVHPDIAKRIYLLSKVRYYVKFHLPTANNILCTL